MKKLADTDDMIFEFFKYIIIIVAPREYENSICIVRANEAIDLYRLGIAIMTIFLEKFTKNFFNTKYCKF